MLLLYFLVGIIIGIITGLIPGLHPNSVLFLLLPLYFRFKLDFLDFIGFVVGISVTNTVLNYIPSVLLGVPQEDTVLSVLPGHKFVLDGRGYEAIALTILGALSSTVFALVLLPLLFVLIPFVYPFLASYMQYVLLLLIATMLFRRKRKILSLMILFLSGLLGLITLNSNLGNMYTLFPAFSGLFGIPMIIFSLIHGGKIPKQNKNEKINSKDVILGGFFGFLAGILTGFIPGIGSSQSALIVQRFSNMKIKRFMVALGGINTTGIFFSILSLYLINKARSGAAIIIQNISTRLTLPMVFIIISLSMICLGLVVPLGLKIGKISCSVVNKINYKILLYSVLFLIIFGTIILTSWFGLIVLITSTALGFLTAQIGVNRNWCMGVLLVPTILYYFGFSGIVSLIF